MISSYLDINFEVVKAAENSRYANDNDIRLSNSGPIASLRNYISTTSSGKHLGDTDHAHVVPSTYKLITGSKGSEYLSIGFNIDRELRQREQIFEKKIQKVDMDGGFKLRDVIHFAVHQEKTTYDLGNK